MKPLIRPQHARRTQFRVRPQLGRPRCLVEQFAQHVFVHRLAWYASFAGAAAFVFQVTLDGNLHHWIFG